MNTILAKLLSYWFNWDTADFVRRLSKLPILPPRMLSEYRGGFALSGYNVYIGT